ncbi:hypothetical protein ACFX13_012311 [Malus domestica]|uniref:GDSL esterase/lipase At4g16230-like isoform X1 n=1 Tax=Malus domestica TaxID=3750 RepID=UPI0010AB3622|nr:GDSL esterase/lipase At4g16230-like isoform X1 [Malus domestica]
MMWIIFQTVTVYFLLVTCSAKNNFPAFLTFANSLADVGNNNYLPTIVKGNFYPNGIDFGKPTGRFTNGRTVFDILQQEMGFKNFTPPYLAPTTVGDMLLQGVNYASSASGISNSTETFYGTLLNFDTQISYHGRTAIAIMSRIGIPAAQKLLSRAIYAIAIGSNDIMYSETSSMSEEDYFDFLISRLKLGLKTLHSLDARKIVVANAGLIVCIPYEKDIHPVPKGSCVRILNRTAQRYNAKLKGLLVELNKNLKGAKFIYADIYQMLEDLSNNYVSYGFENGVSACCSVAGPQGGLIPCTFLSKICPDRSKYLFWDPFHLTEAGNLIAARHMMDGNSTYMSPMNIRQLLQV